MAYCTTDDVQALFKNFVFTSSSKVTLAELQDIINDISADIDMRIGVQYQTPVTAPKSAQFLKVVCRRLSAAEAWDRLYLTQEGDSKDTASSEWYNQGMEDLESIVMGTIILPDAGTTADTPEPLHSRITSNTLMNTCMPDRKFSMTKRW